MNILNYNHNGIDNLDEVKSNKKTIIKIDNSLFSIHSIHNKNLNIIQAKKSIPFILEPDLLDDIDDLSFFIKKIGAVFNIVVIKKSILAELKKIIQTKKLDIIGAYLSFMFVPYIKDKISYKENGDNIIFRTGDFNGGELQKSIFFTIFKDKELLETQSTANDYQKINLLQYDFSDTWTKFIKPWFWVFILIIVIFITKIIVVSVESQRTQNNLQTLHTKNTQLFKEIFPNIKNIVDIKVQAQQEMNKLNKQKSLTTNDFLSAIIQENITGNGTKSLIFDKKLEVK